VNATEEAVVAAARAAHEMQRAFLARHHQPDPGPWEEQGAMVQYHLRMGVLPIVQAAFTATPVVPAAALDDLATKTQEEHAGWGGAEESLSDGFAAELRTLVKAAASA
jgi:hypothetical protein